MSDDSGWIEPELQGGCRNVDVGPTGIQELIGSRVEAANGTVFGESFIIPDEYTVVLDMTPLIPAIEELDPATRAKVSDAIERAFAVPPWVTGRACPPGRVGRAWWWARRWLLSAAHDIRDRFRR